MQKLTENLTSFTTRLLAILAIVISASALQGCKLLRSDGSEKAEKTSGTVDKDGAIISTSLASNKKNLSTEPTLQTGFILRISVMIEDSEEVAPTEVQISDKEEISLPLIGTVSCRGLTIDSLRSRLTTYYEKFLRNPEVTVSFVYNDDGISPYGQILVQGTVMREGWVNIPPTRTLKLTRAIQMCGGFAPSAKKRSVKVTRTNEDGTKYCQIINVESIGKDGKLENDITLEANDIVYVEESSF